MVTRFKDFDVYNPKPIPGHYSMRQLMQHYDLEEYFNDGDFADAMIPWINRNNYESINRALKNWKFIALSQIILFGKIHGVTNFSEPFTTIHEFEGSMNKPVTAWRGGAGIYDPNWIPKNRKWVSFTITRKRVNTFAVYNGTHSYSGFHQLEKNRQYWIVEIKIPFKDILLHIYNGSDDEIIVPIEYAKRARVVEAVQ